MSGIDATFKGRVGNFGLDVRFTTPERGLTALFGLSGCGKTTVLRCIAGLAKLDHGMLKVGEAVWQDADRFLKPHLRAVGYVFQEANLFAHLTVEQNLAFGMKRAGVKDARGLRDIVDLMGIAGHLKRDPGTLSGGERQRVAIARALLAKPDILLMDEPLSALDRFAKNDILPYFETLSDKLNIPIIHVTHDLAEVERLARHMVLMEKGRVRAAGSLETLLPDLDLPMSRTGEAGVVLNARVLDYDNIYDLTTLDMGGCSLIAPGRLGNMGQIRRIRLPAKNISLSRTAATDSTVLNIIPSRIKSHRTLDRARSMVRLNMGSEGRGPDILAQITKKSWDDNGLRDGETVHAQIKGVALTGETPQGVETTPSRQPLARTLAQVSLNPTTRLKTGASSVPSGSGQK